jgi:hypothetical protein
LHPHPHSRNITSRATPGGFYADVAAFLAALRDALNLV